MAYCRLVSLSGPMKRHNRRIWKEWSESGVEGKGQQRENREGDRREEEGGGDISINRKQQAARGAMVGRNGWRCDWLDWIRNSSTLQTWASCDDLRTQTVNYLHLFQLTSNTTICYMSKNFKWKFHTPTGWSEWFLHLFTSSFASHVQRHFFTPPMQSRLERVW